MKFLDKYNQLEKEMNQALGNLSLMLDTRTVYLEVPLFMTKGLIMVTFGNQHTFDSCPDTMEWIDFEIQEEEGYGDLERTLQEGSLTDLLSDWPALCCDLVDEILEQDWRTK